MLIEPSRWSEYLAELSRQAEGYDTAIEVLSDQLGDQVEARSAPLNELSFDAREGIAISVGKPGMLRHVVTHPSRMEASDEPGVPAALLVEDEEGTKTLIRFAAPGTDG